MKNNWKEDFDKEFTRDTGLMRITPYSPTDKTMVDSIKDFIDSLLEEQKKELIDELPQELGESEHNEAYKKGFNFCREKIINIINHH